MGCHIPITYMYVHILNNNGSKSDFYLLSMLIHWPSLQVNWFSEHVVNFIFLIVGPPSSVHKSFETPLKDGVYQFLSRVKEICLNEKISNN